MPTNAGLRAIRVHGGAGALGQPAQSALSRRPYPGQRHRRGMSGYNPVENARSIGSLARIVFPTFERELIAMATPSMMFIISNVKSS